MKAGLTFGIFMLSLRDKEAAEEFLNELAHSYSDSRANFGVEGTIWARTMDVIKE